MTNQTIEGHVVELYTQGRLGLADMLKLVRFSHLNEVKRVIQDTFGGDIEKLKPIKEQLEFEEKKDVSYFEIKVAIAMMERGDL
ncbi:MAG: helix-turn-helix domain-containing protein [Candidatus Peribacteria bacterium]|nr:MAG: helix-turn-helix domain-containing protein [Candidatus Peribacteria bacterium]